MASSECFLQIDLAGATAAGSSQPAGLDEKTAARQGRAAVAISVCYWLRSGTEHPSHSTRVGRMVMMMMMMPDRRLFSHGMKLEEEVEVVKAPGGGRVPHGAPLR